MFSTISPATMVADLGSRIRALRLQRNITQAALASQSGVSTPTLAALEEGRGTLATLAHVMYALGREAEVETLFVPDPPSTLAEVVKPRVRRRARP